MIPYKKILIPTDGSNDTRAAITFALGMGKITGAEVTAMCVNDVSNYAIPWDASAPDTDSPHYKACEKAVRTVADRGVQMGVDVRTLVVTGIPLREIIDASKNYDLIVMGTTGRAGVSLMLLGSVAQKVIRFASCPVLVIRGDQPGGLACHRILIPTDGTSITRTAITHGLEMARAFNAEVTALSVSSGRSIPLPLRRNAEQFTPEVLPEGGGFRGRYGQEARHCGKTRGRHGLCRKRDHPGFSRSGPSRHGNQRPYRL